MGVAASSSPTSSCAEVVNGYKTFETLDGTYVITGPGHGLTMKGYFVPNQKLPMWRRLENILMDTPWDHSLEGRNKLFPRIFSGSFLRRAAIPFMGCVPMYLLWQECRKAGPVGYNKEEVTED